MNMPYIKVFPDISGTVDLLSDAEAGRLFKAVLHYGAGSEEALSGQERLVFAMLKTQIDRDNASYQQYTDKQRSNGAKGGRPKNPENPVVLNENPENPVVFLKTQKSQDKEKEEEKEEDKDKEKDGGGIYNAPAPADALIAYAANNLKYLSPTNVEELDSFRDSLTDDMIQWAIDETCANGSRSYSYARKILNRMVESGFKTLGEVKTYEEQREKLKAQKANPSKIMDERKDSESDYSDWYKVELKNG